MAGFLVIVEFSVSEPPLGPGKNKCTCKQPDYYCRYRISSDLESDLRFAGEGGYWLAKYKLIALRAYGIVAIWHLFGQ